MFVYLKCVCVLYCICMPRCGKDIQFDVLYIIFQSILPMNDFITIYLKFTKIDWVFYAQHASLSCFSHTFWTFTLLFSFQNNFILLCFVELFLSLFNLQTINILYLISTENRERKSINCNICFC